jgi:hypothetical protein
MPDNEVVVSAVKFTIAATQEITCQGKKFSWWFLAFSVSSRNFILGGEVRRLHGCHGKG